MLARLVVVCLAALGAGCGGRSPSPTAPLPFDTATESYQGLYRIVGCGSDCDLTDHPWPFFLTITWAADNPSGTIRTEPWGLETKLTGRKAADGQFVFTGTPAHPDASVAGTEFTLALKKDPGLQRLAGTFSYVLTRPSGPSMIVKAEISSIELAAGAAGARDFSGTWVGVGKAERRCYADWGCFDPSFGVALARRGAGYAGIAQLRMRGAFPLSVMIAGVVEGESLVLDGTLPKSPGRLLDIGQQLRLRLRFLPSGEMVGDYHLIESQSSYSQDHRGVLMGGNRAPDVPAGEVSGSWDGWFLQESCSGDCGQLHSTRIPVTITRAGSQVTGIFAEFLRMTGTLSGSQLVLEGESTRPCIAKSGKPCSYRLRIVMTGIDEWGVMTGSATHSEDSQFWTFTKSGRLWNFTRRIQ